METLIFLLKVHCTTKPESLYWIGRGYKVACMIRKSENFQASWLHIPVLHYNSVKALLVTQNPANFPVDASLAILSNG